MPITTTADDVDQPLPIQPGVRNLEELRQRRYARVLNDDPGTEAAQAVLAVYAAEAAAARARVTAVRADLDYVAARDAADKLAEQAERQALQAAARAAATEPRAMARAAAQRAADAAAEAQRLAEEADAADAKAARPVKSVA